MREGINGHVAAEHAPLGTEHLHQRHYPRLQLLLVPIHAEDAFHGRDADAGVTASADGAQVGLPSPIAIDAKINRPAHYCDREANFWILADYVQEIGQLRGEHFQPAAQICSLQALKTLQPLWVRHQIGPWSEAAKRIVGVPSEMLAHGSQVRKRAVDIQALRQVWIAEVNQANKRNWDFQSYSQLLRPRHLLDGILGDEFVPDEAVNLPRAGCSEIVIEKVSPWQRGVIPDKSFKSRIFPCKNTVAVGSAVVEMSVRIDDCCPAGERGSCHLLDLQRVPGDAGCRRRAGLRLRSRRPRRPAGEQRDELAASQVIELHLLPVSKTVIVANDPFRAFECAVLLNSFELSQQ